MQGGFFYRISEYRIGLVFGSEMQRLNLLGACTGQVATKAEQGFLFSAGGMVIAVGGRRHGLDCGRNAHA
jgi:hypothetical protein